MSKEEKIKKLEKQISFARGKFSDACHWITGNAYEKQRWGKRLAKLKIELRRARSA